MTTGELGREYADGEVVFMQGDEGDLMYVIQSGRVKVSVNTSQGEVTIATLGKGDVFGEMALFEKKPRSATVTAMENARILSVDRNRFFASVSRDPSMAFNLLKTMSQRLRRIDNEFSILKERRLEILRSGMDVDMTCRIILKEASDAVQADNGSVMLLDSEDGTLRIRAAFGTETPTKANLCQGEGIAGHVLATGRAELVNNVVLDPRYKPGALSISSIICVPLRIDERSLGVINLSHVSTERLFSQVDLKFIQSLSIYASVAVRNALSLSSMYKATESLIRSADESFSSAGGGDDEGEGFE